MEAFISSGLTALIILTFLEIALGLFPSESYFLRAQTPQSPSGHYHCRDWEKQPTTLLAVLVLHGDGTYEAIDRMKDLQANRPTTTCDITMNDPNSKLTGPRASGVIGLDFTCLARKVRTSLSFNTKRDPEGKLDGTLRGARTLSPQ